MIQAFIDVYTRNPLRLIPHTIKSILLSFGVLWVIVEPLAWFFPKISEYAKPLWWVFLISGIIIGLIKSFQHLHVKRRITGKDVQITIAVGDIFRFNGIMVIGTNSTFDSSLENDIVSEKSLQGQFTQRYFSSRINELDRMISASICGVQSVTLTGQEKSYGKLQRYPIGTVAKIQTDQKLAYLLAVSDLNANKVSVTELENIRFALLELWGYCRDKGDYGEFCISVIGTGFTRLNESRERVIKEIIKSFVASCNEGKFCDNLTIVIGIDDFIKHKVDIDHLEHYLDYACSFASTEIVNTGRGTPVTPS